MIWKSPAEVKIRPWSCRAYLDDGDRSLLAVGPAFVYIATGFPLHGSVMLEMKESETGTHEHA